LIKKRTFWFIYITKYWTQCNIITACWRHTVYAIRPRGTREIPAVHIPRVKKFYSQHQYFSLSTVDACAVGFIAGSHVLNRALVYPCGRQSIDFTSPQAA